MGLKSFLKNQGFIEEDKPSSADKKQSSTPAAPVTPTYFPITETGTTTGDGGDPSFVTPLQKASVPQQEVVDPNFVKFFEDEMLKANLEGPDYFEFRQQLLKTQQKMSAKGMAATDVVLQAVLMSFDAQGVSADKLVSAAKHYKTVIKQKNDDFIKGAEAEKSNQLQKRQSVLQSHTDNLASLEQQLQKLELQKQQILDAINKEKTQQEVDKSLGKEGIEKIDRAERLINVAHNYMQTTIDKDIENLQAV